jgi:O-antigen/teichoic acid export membrane protein
MALSVPSDLRALLQKGAFRSLASLLIKVATAGLTYITYVVLSRTQTPEEYGHFAFGLALATVLAIVAGLGQPTAIMRLWAQLRGAGENAQAREAISAASLLTFMGSLVLGALLALATWAYSPFLELGETANHFLGAALLILPLALSEFNSAALRAQGSLWTALLPRDIFWRLSVPLVVVGLFYSGIVLSGPDALALAAGLLLLVLFLQIYAARRNGYVLMPSLAGLRPYWARWKGLSLWMLAAAIIETATLNADVILVGLMLDLEGSGLYFNAIRTAGLMTLFTFALELVIAPMVAEHYHAHDLRKAQAITAMASWAGFVFSLGIFAVFFVFGEELMHLFGESYAEGWIILILLSFGLLFDAITGPSKIVMMMTGHERAYVWLFGGIMGLGFALQLYAIPRYGLVGAAAVNMGSRILAQCAIAAWCRIKIGIDTSILGGLFPSKKPISN